MTSFELKIAVCLMFVTILAVAVLLLASQETSKNIPEDQTAGPLKQLRIFNVNHPLEGAVVMLGIIGCGSGLAIFLVKESV